MVTRERARSSLVVVKFEDEASRNPDGSNYFVQSPDAVVSLEPETLLRTLGWYSDMCILAYERIVRSDGTVSVVHLCPAVPLPHSMGVFGDFLLGFSSFGPKHVVYALFASS